MKNKTLLIIAAGIKSRYGSIKQMEKVGPNKELIIDYSIYDAIKAGFTKVVFVIKQEFGREFKNTLEKRINSKIEVEYVYQDNSFIPKKYQILLSKRNKPLGTAYAIYCAKDKINEPFAVINADDFYGFDAYLKASKYLDNIIYNHYAVIGYEAFKTLSINGIYKRGIMEVNNNILKKIEEVKMSLKDNKVLTSKLESSKVQEIAKDTLVSTNFLIFNKDIFKVLEEELIDFLAINQKKILEVEFMIPTILNNCLRKNIKTIDVIKTTSTLYDLTYQEDKQIVKKALKELTDQKVYKSPLWDL